MLCVICKFDTELDDIVLNFPRGKCLCLRCYDREMGIAPMPKSLQKEVTVAANVTLT